MKCHDSSSVELLLSMSDNLGTSRPKQPAFQQARLHDLTDYIESAQ